MARGPWLSTPCVHYLCSSPRVQQTVLQRWHHTQHKMEAGLWCWASALLPFPFPVEPATLLEGSNLLPGELEVLGVQSLSSSHILWTIESCFGGPLSEHISSLSFSSSSDVPFSLNPLQQLLTLDDERESGCITQYPEVWLLSILWNASIQHHHAYCYTQA